eukprot:4600285-Lingulodinium_polyedra.AAC.1
MVTSSSTWPRGPSRRSPGPRSSRSSPARRRCIVARVWRGASRDGSTGIWCRRPSRLWRGSWGQTEEP